MAGFALVRRRLEICFAQGGPQIGGEMASRAGHSTVRSEKLEGSCRVIETIELFPCGHCMTGLATQSGAIRPALGHALGELPFVRVGVTCCTSAVVEAVLHRAWRKDRGIWFVAFDAGRRCVCPAQREARLLMIDQSNSHGMKSLHRVAVFAAILVRRSSELSLVRVHVA